MKAFNIKSVTRAVVEAFAGAESARLLGVESKKSAWHETASAYTHAPEDVRAMLHESIKTAAQAMFGTIRAGAGKTCINASLLAEKALRDGFPLFKEDGTIQGMSALSTAIKAKEAKAAPEGSDDASKPSAVKVITGETIASVLAMLCDPDIAKQYVVGILSAAQASGMIEARMLPDAATQAANLKALAKSKAKFAKEQAAADKDMAKAAAKRDKEIARLLTKPLADVSRVPAMQALADQNTAPIAQAA